MCASFEQPLIRLDDWNTIATIVIPGTATRDMRCGFDRFERVRQNWNPVLRPNALYY